MISEVIIDPPGAGTATFEIVDDGLEYHSVHIIPTAFPNPGFRFAKFMARVHYVTYGSSGQITQDEYVDYHDSANPSRSRYFCDSDTERTYDAFRLTATVVSITAYFEEIGPAHTHKILRDGQSGLILRNSSGLILRDD